MIIWPSPAKLNLFLYIIGKRHENNYHNLQTLFQLVDYGDTLQFQLRKDNVIQVTTPLLGVADKNHLALIAAQTLKTYAQTHCFSPPPFWGVDIDVKKRIPMGAGLGGGSSNAATTLVALNRLWKLNLSTSCLLDIGRSIGADVPLFIAGHSAFAEGIGDQLTPLLLSKRLFLIVTPNVAISTKAIFTHPNLLRNTPKRTLEECLSHPYSNDIEPLVRHLYPSIDAIITQLHAIAPFRLTGTGSSIFAAFHTKTEAEAAQRELPLGLNSFITAGINHSPLCEFLVP